MRNRHYLGDAYYPAIIDRETFDKAEQELKKRAEKLVRRLVEKVTVYDEKIAVEFKPGVEIEVDR